MTSSNCSSQVMLFYCFPPPVTGHIQIQNVDCQSSSTDSPEEADQPQESADQLEQSDEEA